MLERPLHPAGRAILDAAPDVTVAVATDAADFASRAPEAEAILLWRPGSIAPFSTPAGG